jgi:hypothetical protein
MGLNETLLMKVINIQNATVYDFHCKIDIFIGKHEIMFLESLLLFNE